MTQKRARDSSSTINKGTIIGFWLGSTNNTTICPSPHKNESMLPSKPSFATSMNVFKEA